MLNVLIKSYEGATWAAFVANVQDSRFFGGHETLLALATAYSITIVVLELDGSRNTIEPIPGVLADRRVTIVHTPDRGEGGTAGHYYGTRALVDSTDPIKRRLAEADKPKVRISPSFFFFFYFFFFLCLQKGRSWRCWSSDSYWRSWKKGRSSSKSK